MKLFQKLLVAGTALGVLTPMAAQASEAFNLEAMNSYERSGSKAKRFDSTTFTTEVSNEIATLKGRIDGLEVRQGDIEAGSFSNTTTLDGKAIFSVGALNYHDSSVTSSEAVQAYYSYTMNLNSSITGGDDNLYVRIKTGNTNDWMKSTTYGAYLSSAKGNSDDLKIDKIWYQFPIGDNNTVWVGPKIENYYMHGTSPSIYKPVTKQFTLGGNGHAYGASTDTGAGWAYKADNGFAISSNIGTKSLTSCRVDGEVCTATSGSYVPTGILTDETKTSWATQIGYTQPNYSASAIVNVKYNGWSDSYYKAGDVNGDAEARSNMTSIGLRGWWRPDDTGTAIPSISVGFDTTEYDTASDNQSNSTAYFVGLNWNDIFQADDKIGVAFGQPTTNENLSGADPFAYEVYYSFKPNDSVTVTPAIFGGSDRNGTAAGDVTGAVLETTFKF